MVSTVSNPSDTRPGIASMLSQKDTQERTTIRILGIYIWIRKNPIARFRTKRISKQGNAPVMCGEREEEESDELVGCSTCNVVDCEILVGMILHMLEIWLGILVQAEVHNHGNHQVTSRLIVFVLISSLRCIF